MGDDIGNKRALNMQIMSSALGCPSPMSPSQVT
jgi:hypothetical protein